MEWKLAGKRASSLGPFLFPSMMFQKQSGDLGDHGDSRVTCLATIDQMGAGQIAAKPFVVAIADSF
jgi:hypothetical protein